MEPIQVLNAIFTRTGLRRSDRIPLYAYRINTAELSQLRDSLRTELSIRPRPERGDICAAFCLFAAEWFRRNHEDGAWSWGFIFREGLRLEAEALRLADSQINRTQMVEKGLHWWGLPLVETEGSTRYLVSLACQGGLPLKTLKKQNSRLKKFFEESLVHHERWPTEPLPDVIARFSVDLPESLKNPVVDQLATQLVRAVANLRRQSRDASESASARIAFLDRHFPRWQDELPLRIDDDEREQLELLIGLLSKKTAQTSADEFPAISTVLSLTRTNGTISRRLAAGKSITEECLFRFLNLSDGRQLKPRLTFLLVGGGIRTPVASVTQRSGKAEFSVREFQTSLSGPAAIGEVLLAAEFGSELISTVSIGGGQELSDAPWIFAPQGDQQGNYRLLGIGSVRTRETTVVVAIPEGAAIPEGQADLRVLLQTVAGRRLVEVSGELEVSYDENTYRVRTQTVEESVSLFWLTGRQVTCGLAGSVVWAGPPRILEIFPDKTVKEVATQSIQWKSAGRGNEWRAGLTSVPGRLRLRIVRDGVTVFHQTMTILPYRFAARITPTNMHSGRITLSGLGDNVRVSMAADDQLQSSIVHEQDQTTIECSVQNNSRPPFVNLKLQFTDHEEVEIQVPCPTPWGGLVDAGGRVHPGDSPLPLSSLKSYFLRIISPRPQVPQLSSDFSGLRTFLAKLRNSDQAAGNTFELPLSVIAKRVSSMMSSTDEMDETVQLVVTQGVAPEPLFRLRVSRYPGSLEKEQPVTGDGSEAVITDVYLPDGMQERLRLRDDQIRLDLAAIVWPDRPVASDALTKIGPLRWRIFHEQLQPGPYLITPWLDEFTSLRPMRISVRDGVPVAAPESWTKGSVDELEQVCRIWDGELRRAAWRQTIDILAQDVNAEGWCRVDAMLSASEHRPMTTFESVIALAQNPLAMARTGIIHADKHWIWNRMEELPFLWCLIPIQHWVKVVLSIRHKQHTRFAAVGLEEAEIEQILRKELSTFLDGTSGRPAVLSAAAACLPFALLSIPQDENFHRLLPSQVKSLLEDREKERAILISRHTADNLWDSWPMWEVGLPAEGPVEWQDLLITECPNYQKPVLNGPVIAAAHSVFSVPADEQQLKKLQELRGFDNDWFDRCFEIISFILAGRRFAKNKQWINEDQ